MMNFLKTDKIKKTTPTVQNLEGRFAVIFSHASVLKRMHRRRNASPARNELL